MNFTRPGPWAERFRFGLALVLIAACFLWGGGSRLDIPGLIFLQPLAILIGAALILVPGEMRWAAVRAPLFLLTALATVIGAQLVPLPPALWEALPGRDQFAPFVEAAGVSAVWRPLSLTPDLTLASLVGLSVPAAGLIAFASLPEERTHQLLLYLLIAAGLSAVLGLVQLIGGANGAFYLYAVTNEGSAVGLFANRNHQALFIAMTWPMLATLALSGGVDPQRQPLRQWICGAIAIALIPLVIVIGSRAGLVLGLCGLVLAGWPLRRRRRSPALPQRDRSARAAATRNATRALAVAAVVIVFTATIFVSRDEAIQRLFTMNVSDDVRVEYLPALMRIAGDFLPFGSGFGSFDPVFRYYEPEQLLQPLYLNHAHNDWLELIITGGLPAAAIAIAFLIWVIRRLRSLKGNQANAARNRYAYLAASMIILELLASSVDYPLRTPIHALLLAFAAGWLAAPGMDSRRGARAGKPLRSVETGLEAVPPG